MMIYISDKNVFIIFILVHSQKKITVRDLDLIVSTFNQVKNIYFHNQKNITWF